MRTFTLIISSLYLLFCNLTFAQSAVPLAELSAEDLAEFKRSVQNKLEELGNKMGVLASKKHPYQVKKLYKEQTYKLFNDLGYPHFVEISFRGNKRKIPTRPYFNNLSRLSYAEVEVKFTNILYISNFTKTPDGKYIASATIMQKFKGFDSEGKPMYESIDTKIIEVIIERKKDFWGELKWVAVLGDITVNHTEEVKR